MSFFSSFFGGVGWVLMGLNRDDYYDFPESGWDKLMALNVKSLFYTTVELEPLLLKGATPDEPGRVINVASMAGIQTQDVTTGEGGGLSQPGHGTFSCKFFFSTTAVNLQFFLCEC